MAERNERNGRNERREQRKAEAAKHLGLMKGVFSQEIQATVDAATIYEDGDARSIELPEPAFEQTATRVTTAFPATAVMQTEGRVAVVDPASFTRPGGNYLDGAFGPEQALCADSALYPVLVALKKEYHDANRGYAAGQLFTDRALFLPDVVFNREGMTKKADVIAIPEPVRGRALENHRSEQECDRVIANRIPAFLNIAAANGCETLVCGAFGCGRQGYDSDMIIGVFQDWLDAHPGALKEIVFAVPRAQYDSFELAFGAPIVEEPEPVVVDTAEDEDAFDPHSIELPEGVTLR